MPFYRFMVHGRDPRYPVGVRGFYTTRHAFAANADKAAQKVLARLHHEFTVGVSAAIWQGYPPILDIETSRHIGLWELWSAPNKGSTFYGL